MFFKELSKPSSRYLLKDLKNTSRKRLYNNLFSLLDRWWCPHPLFAIVCGYNADALVRNMQRGVEAKSQVRKGNLRPRNYQENGVLFFLQNAR